MNTIPMKVTEGLTVSVIPDSSHEFLMTTRQVAVGYGVSDSRIRHHSEEHPGELFEGKHFLSNVRIPHVASSGSSTGTMWTKRGIVRLGFFVKSENARLFRDWAEDLIINHVEKKQTAFAEIDKKLQDRYLKPPEYDEDIETIKSAIIACGSANKLADRIGINSGVLSLIKSRPWLVSPENMKSIMRACRNLLARDMEFGSETFEELLRIDDTDLRLSLYGKFKRVGLI